MKIGDAFLMSVPPRYIRHLYFVISDPSKHNGNFIVVNITGDRFRTGEECILNVGDHPWIKKKSFVAYADALELTPKQEQTIKKAIGKRVELQPCLSEQVLSKIVDAAKKSTAIAENLKKYL
jgi:hypothetical protein